MVIIIFISILITGVFFIWKKDTTTITKKEDPPIDNQLFDQTGNTQSVDYIAGTYVTKDGCELCHPGYYSYEKKIVRPVRHVQLENILQCMDQDGG